MGSQIVDMSKVTFDLIIGQRGRLANPDNHISIRQVDGNWTIFKDGQPWDYTPTLQAAAIAGLEEANEEIARLRQEIEALKKQGSI